ncbi:MAG: Npun_F0494 family protein [Cyanobacteria bacterium J06634_5]
MDLSKSCDESGANATSQHSSPVSGDDPAMQYSSQSIRRAQRAVRCSPFYTKLLAEMRVSSVGILTIAEDSGMLKGYTQQPLSDRKAESELMWLAAVGILRREVDGQGLTDSFRLTPLGRQLVEQWQSQGCPDDRASLMDYIKNTALRRLRIPDWLA